MNITDTCTPFPRLFVPGADIRQRVSTIRFEDATAKSGIHFTHSFGSQKLGSLLESTGAGCVWFDYNNDGFPTFMLRAEGRSKTASIRIR